MTEQQDQHHLLSAGNTPILMTTTSLLVVLGFDERGEQTVMAVCLPSQLKQTATMIFSTYHQTKMVATYDMKLGVYPKATYTQQEAARLLL